MNNLSYTEKKAKEICDLLGIDSAIRFRQIELMIKSIVRDTRHKATDNLMDAYQEYPFLAGKLNQIVMDTCLD